MGGFMPAGPAGMWDDAGVSSTGPTCGSPIRPSPSPRVGRWIRRVGVPVLRSPPSDLLRGRYRSALGLPRK